MPEFDGNPLNGWFGAVASHDKGSPCEDIDFEGKNFVPAESEVVHSHLSSTEVRRRWDTRLQRPANSVNSSSEQMGLIQDQLKTRPGFDGNPLNGWFGAVASDDKGRYEGVRSLTRHDWVQSLDLLDHHSDFWAGYS
ncbi:hypothetical protein Tco_0105736 [Tanacetum coccineum]